MSSYVVDARRADINQCRYRLLAELRSTVAGRDMAIDEKNLQIAELRSDVVHRDKQINRLESTYDSMYSAMLEDNQAIMKDLKKSQQDIEGVDAELSVRKQDSTVLMHVVNIINAQHDDVLGRVKYAVRDYLNDPEIPESKVSEILTLQTPSIDHQAEMSAVKNLLNETIKDLRMAAGDMLDQLNDRARKAELYKKEINRLRRIIGMADEEINELSSRYCDRCDQLEEIKKIIMEK